jgi:phosphoenolpyruvate carboxylase
MMLLHVGAYEYAVVIQGKGSRVSPPDRTIYLGADVRVAERLEKLVHELWHAWLLHVPRPRSEEEQAKLLELVMSSFWRDLARQGGERALRNLREERPVLELVYEPCP